MNGATEATLAELLRVAQEQNANIASLNQLLAGQSGGGGGGGIGSGVANLGKGLPILSAAFSVLGAAVGVVGTVFEMLGNVVGKMIDGIGSVIKGLWSFSQKAMEGTARMSDLFDAFGRLPFFIGELFQIGAGLLRVLEKLTDQFIEMSKIGAGFTGGLTEMRDISQSLGISFADLAAMTSKNSQALADAGGTVSNGFKKFVGGMDVLMGEGSQFRNSMFALGVGSKEAGEYMMTTMKLNQTQIRTGQMDAASLGVKTRDYIENLDQLTRLTGLHRDQVNEIVKKQADDQIFENFRATLSPEKAEEIKNLIAMSTATMGEEYTENVLKPQLMGIDGPINEAAVKIAQATGGVSVDMARQIAQIQNSNMSAQEKMKQTYLVFGKIAVAGKTLTDQMGAQARMDGMPTANRVILKFAQLMENGGEAAYAAMMAEQGLTKENQAAQVALMAAQERMTKFGNEMTLMIAGIALQFGPDLINIGNMILTELIGGIRDFAKWLKSPEVKQAWATLVDFFNGVILPKLQAIGKWFGDTWDQLVKAWTQDGISGVMKVMEDRIKDGITNIWNQIQKIWEVVSPGLIAIWNKDIKPVLVELWTKLMDSMLTVVGDAIKSWMFGPKMTTPEGKANMDRRAKDVAADTPMWLKPVTALGDLMEAAANKIASPDVAERMRNQTILDNEWILDLFGYRGRHASGTVGAKAGGGLVDPGTYLVGERGPELLSVGASGNVITNENLQKLLNRLAGDSDNNYIASALEELNKTMSRIENHSASTADYSRRTVGAIAQIGGDIMPAI
jgi:hypothetical protein